MVDGMPWSFEFMGCPVTHSNDECYIISTPDGELYISPTDSLTIDKNGKIRVCMTGDFEAADKAEGKNPIEAEELIRWIENAKLDNYVRYTHLTIDENESIISLLANRLLGIQSAFDCVICHIRESQDRAVKPE
jgi:hypothetical protein